MGVVYAVRTTVEAAHEGEWRRWQDEEHVPQLLALPGYRGLHRFQDLQRPCTYLNIWRIDHPDAQQGPRYRAASLTEWFDRIRPHYDVSVEFSREPDGPPEPDTGAPWRQDVRGLVVDRWDAAGTVPAAAAEAALARLTAPAGDLVQMVRLPRLIEDHGPAPRSAPSTVVLHHLRSVPSTTAPVALPEGVERRRYRAIGGYRPAPTG